MHIASLDDLRPGDIMICSQEDAPARLLVNVGQLLLRDHFRIGVFTAGHVGVIGPNGKLIEAMPSGARARDLRPTDWSATHAYFRLPEDYPGQAESAAWIANLMLRTPYSFMSYAYLGAYIAGLEAEWIAEWIDRRRKPIPVFLNKHMGVQELALPVEAICSVLVDQAWTLAGKKVIRGTRPQVVTPGMLARQLWNYPGIIRSELF